MVARTSACILMSTVATIGVDAREAFSEPGSPHHAWVQSTDSAPRPAPRPRPAAGNGDAAGSRTSGNPVSDGLDPVPSEFEVLGLSIRLPAGSVFRAEGVGVNAAWIVTERTEAPRWILRLSRLVASEPTSSPARQVDELIKTVSERPAPDTVFSVRERKEFSLGTLPAATLYTLLREGTGDDEVAAIQGYFIVQVEPNEFIVISSLVPEAEFEGVRPMLERCFRSTEIKDAEAVAMAREARMVRGDRLLAALDERALRALLDPVPAGAKEPAPRWFRISRTLGDGTARETGYMTILAIEGEQGLANPDRRPNEWTVEEREKGLAVRVRVRSLLDERGTSVLDTDARYWMRWDRAREFWTVRSTTRAGTTTKTSSQLGIRTLPSVGMPRPTLQVATVDLDHPATEPRKWSVPPGYVSQAEALLLTRALPHVEAADFGFYWFDPASGRLAQRLDRVTPGAGGFTVRTRATLEAPFLEQRCDAAGNILRRTTDDGSTVEAIEPQALLDLWKRKGLPTQ